MTFKDSAKIRQIISNAFGELVKLSSNVSIIQSEGSLKVSFWKSIYSSLPSYTRFKFPNFISNWYCERNIYFSRTDIILCLFYSIGQPNIRWTTVTSPLNHSKYWLSLYKSKLSHYKILYLRYIICNLKIIRNTPDLGERTKYGK